MKLSSKFIFMGLEARASFKDASKMNYIIALAQGIDSLRIHVDASFYEKYRDTMPYSECNVVLDFNPRAASVIYCMQLESIEVIGSDKHNGASK